VLYLLDLYLQTDKFVSEPNKSEPHELVKLFTQKRTHVCVVEGMLVCPRKAHPLLTELSVSFGRHTTKEY
jgi:hypothetical protein